MFIAGLTGTSGAGKGHLCSFLESNNNILIIDTDSLYHNMISHPSATTDALVDEFGSVILNDDKGVDRKMLGSIVFSDKAKLKQLNTIAHYHILQECRKIMAESEKSIAVIDAPQLFESGFDKECDVIIGIVADTELRLDRIMRRDRISREAALKRIENQHSDSWFRQRCDIVIENNFGTLEFEAERVISELERLYGEKEKKKNKV